MAACGHADAGCITAYVNRDLWRTDPGSNLDIAGHSMRIISSQFCFRLRMSAGYGILLTKFIMLYDAKVSGQTVHGDRRQRLEMSRECPKELGECLRVW